MNEKQQELYEKLLKKVNEYCLGYAAEDVIAAIDDLAESYETPKVDLTSKPLEVWSLVKKYLNSYHHQAVSEKVDVETVEGYPISIIEDSLKDYESLKKAFISLSKEDEKTKKLLSKEIEKNRALEIIKKIVVVAELPNLLKTLYDYGKLTKEECDLLKEVLK